MKKISVFFIMISVFMLLAWNGHAATITVNSTADITADDGLCSLREAIAAANTDTASGASVGECSAGSGDDTIDLTGVTGTITLAGTQLSLTTNIAITGPGAANLTISGNNTLRVFEISGTSTVATISALTISNGRATEGGGIRVADASLNLNDCTISNNVSTANASANGGGGLEVSAVTAIANVTNCLFSGNTAVRGGAIHVNAGTLTVTDSTFDSNTANHASDAAYGGGIYSLGTSNVTGSTFKSNTAKTNSGGVYNSTGNTTLTNCTITGNTAGEGGGVRNNGGILTLVNCTVTGNGNGNTTTTQGGGIRQNGGTVNIRNTIVANNTATTSGPDCSGTISSQDYNLIKTTSGCTINGTTTNNITGQDPNLGALADNGGPTPTHALLITPTISPAIDKIPPANCSLSTDQRGQCRPLDHTDTTGSGCDIGAYELEDVLNPNQAPVHTVPGSQTTPQDTALVFSSGNSNLISISDADAACSDNIEVTLTASNGTLTLNGTTGLTFSLGDGTADVKMIFRGTLTAINTALDGLTFTPTTGYTGAATVQITTNDHGSLGTGGTGIDIDTVDITVGITAGVTVSPVTVAVTEGSTGTFNVKLDTAPSGDVTVALSSSDTSACTVPASVTVAAADWSTGADVTVTGVDDADTDNETCTITTGEVSSTDTDYDALGGADVADVTANVTDNDTGFSVSISVVPSTSVLAWDVLTLTPVPSGGTLASVTWQFGDCYTLPCAAGAVQSESTIAAAPFTETFRYPKPGTYAVTLEATDTLSHTATANATITVTGTAPGLTPATSNLGDNLTTGSPVAGDLNGDGVKEVVIPSGHSIRVLGGLTMNLGPATGIFGSAPLFAKNDTTGVINGIFALDTTGRLYGWTTGGAQLWGGPLTVTGITNTSPMASPAIGDIDGDGDLDIVWGGDGDTNGKAYVTAHDILTGDALSGFPVLVSNNVGAGPTYPRTTSVALANVTGGTGREIFIGYNNISTNTGNVMRVAAGGATLNFSMNAGEQIGSGGIPSTQYANSGPTIGDVDNDGVMELVLGGSQGNVYIWNASSGGPSPVLPKAVVNTGSAPITSDPALAYLTDDTGLDIVGANAEGTVFCIRWDSFSSSWKILWQTDLGMHGLLSPVIADVDGDNNLEVIISRMRSGQVLVLENDGSINTGISSATGTAGQINASAAVSDLDRDADYEIMATDDVASPAQDKLYIWDIPKILPTADLRTIIGWPFLRCNYYRDGSITTVNLHPVNVTYDTSAWPLAKFWVHVENKGTGIANNVALKYVSYQPFMSLVSPANGIIMITPNPPASIAAGATGVTEPLTFNMSAYAGQEIIMYFDITYTDASGTEYLIHW